MNEKNPPPPVKGANVYLRHPALEDFTEFSAAAKKSRKLHRGLVSPPTELKSFVEFVARNESDANENLLICRNSDDAVCGAVSLSQIFRKAFQNAYLGYYLFAGYTGKGYMTEAVGLVLRFAFRDLKLHRVEANVQPENAASINVLKRCGFTREGFSRKYLKIAGRWRDHERFAIIIE
ncbi:MAG TPA: GNAT family protein [Pyrinomonadaceae bacterium]|jgi:ribosomal-protein-alanine N-acetyltransferase